jgi:N-acetylglucosamine malate deacetylase 1
MSLRDLIALARHPRTLVDSLLTYPRFLGAIKPGLLARTEAELEARLACLSSGWWPSKLRCPVGRRILAVSPHPDDETIGAGGLLLAHRGQAEISIVTVFGGDGGGLLETSSDVADYKVRLVDARSKELRRACQYFAGTVIGDLGLPDGSIPKPMGPAACRLRELTDVVRPDVVILPHFLDHHADHRTANLLWATACSDIGCIVLGTEIWSLGFANAYFDITEVLPQKLEAIGVFKTQLATVDYISFAEGLAKVRGFHGGLRHRRTGAAEAFFALPNKEYCEIVLKTLGPTGHP